MGPSWPPLLPGQGDATSQANCQGSQYSQSISPWLYWQHWGCLDSNRFGCLFKKCGLHDNGVHFYYMDTFLFSGYGPLQIRRSSGAIQKTCSFCIVTRMQNCNNCEPFLHRSIVSLLVASSSGQLPARRTCNMAIRPTFPQVSMPKGVAIGIGTLRYNRYMSLRRPDTGSSLPRKKLGASVEICANLGFGCDFVLASVDE